MVHVKTCVIATSVHKSIVIRKSNYAQYNELTLREETNKMSRVQTYVLHSLLDSLPHGILSVSPLLFSLIVIGPVSLVLLDCKPFALTEIVNPSRRTSNTQSEHTLQSGEQLKI